MVTSRWLKSIILLLFLTNIGGVWRVQLQAIFVKRLLQCFGHWRNGLIHKNEIKSGLLVLQHGLGFLEEWQQANAHRRNTVADSTFGGQHVTSGELDNSSVIWNIDATLFEAGTRLGHGCVFRTAYNSIIAARNCRLIGSGNPELAETMSFHEALSLSKNRGYNKVLIEMYALSVVNSLRNKTPIS